MAEHGKFVADPPIAQPAPETTSRLERWLPWGAATALNLVLFLVFGLFARVTIQPGVPDPVNRIPVMLVDAADILPEPEEEDEDFSAEASEAPGIAEPEENTSPDLVEKAPVVPEPAEKPEQVEEIPQAAETPPAPSAPPPTPRPAPVPEVELPESGGPSGIVALRCYEIFSNPDKQAECAGRPEVRSGWTAEDADWSGIVSALRKGGVDVEEGVPLFVGPMQAELPEGTENYEPFDDGLIIGPALARQLYNAKRFSEMKDPRGKISEMQSSLDNAYSHIEGASVPWFIERWEPSWVLNDQPNVDQKLIDDLMADHARSRGAEED